MTLDRFIRIVIAVAILLVFIIATGALLFISESALNVWDRLKAGPPALMYAYVSIMLLLAVTALWLTSCAVEPPHNRYQLPAGESQPGESAVALPYYGQGQPAQEKS